MTADQIIPVLLGALGIALLHAVYTDIARREIEDWLNAGIALAAPAFWWATGLELWPDVALQIGVAALVFGFFTLMFAIGMMGGGDVKLLGALALWLPWQPLLHLVVIMSLIGGVLTLGMVIWKTIRKNPEKLEIPYGVAIALAGLWVISQRYFNHFA